MPISARASSCPASTPRTAKTPSNNSNKLIAIIVTIIITTTIITRTITITIIGIIVDIIVLRRWRTRTIKTPDRRTRARRRSERIDAGCLHEARSTTRRSIRTCSAARSGGGRISLTPRSSRDFLSVIPLKTLYTYAATLTTGAGSANPVSSLVVFFL